MRVQGRVLERELWNQPSPIPLSPSPRQPRKAGRGGGLTCSPEALCTLYTELNFPFPSTPPSEEWTKVYSAMPRIKSASGDPSLLLPAPFCAEPDAAAEAEAEEEPREHASAHVGGQGPSLDDDEADEEGERTK